MSDTAERAARMAEEKLAKMPIATAREVVADLVERAKTDVGAPFEANALKALCTIRAHDPAAWQRLRFDLKTAEVRVPDLDRALDNLDGNTGADDKVMGGTALLFPEHERWHDPVDGAALLDALADTFSRHIIMPAGAATAEALWCLHAHTHDAAGISPILAVTSPTPECGKTNLLTVLGALVPKSLPASNITAASLFRAVEKWRPTLLIDEADTFLRDNEELRGVINSGHNRATSFVIRTAGDDHEPRRFMTWAPKAIALIGKLPPTLASRSIHIELRRFALGEHVEPVRPDRLAHLTPLARQAARWAADHVTALRDAEPDMPAILTGRRADNWRPLFAIADAAGGDWPARARKAAEALTAGRSDETAAVILLEDIHAIFAERGDDLIASSELAETLGGREDRPWSEWSRGKPITARGIARLLEPFGVRPTKFRADGYTPGTRGYSRADFIDVFTRWFPDAPALSATAPQLNETGAPSDFTNATTAQGVADREPPNPNETAACGAVADRNDGMAREGGMVGDSAPDDGEVIEWAG